jgi:hypothetical protein
MSCSELDKINSPLTTVIKLQSAETLANFEEAKKYIDVKKTYGIDSPSISPEKVWRSKVLFFHNLGKDKKFTNVFKYYDYDINESINGNYASVSFISISREAKIKEIIYELVKNREGWVVVGIKYIK